MTSTKISRVEKCDQFHEVTANELTSVAGGHFIAFLMGGLLLAGAMEEIRDGVGLADINCND